MGTLAPNTRAGKPPTPLTVQEECIPAELKTMPHWVCWKYEWRDGKWTKPPFASETGRHADSTDPATWTTFAKALTAYRNGSWEGIGFVPIIKLGITAIDLDHCRNPETGVVGPWAEEIIDEMRTYTEVSPSGTGIRIIAFGSKPSTDRYKKGDVEIYDGRTKEGKQGGRYLTVTGQHLDGTPTTIKKRTKAIARVCERVFGVDKPEPKTNTSTNSATKLAGDNRESNGHVANHALTDDEIICRAKTARNGAKFNSLWTGYISGYPSQNEADLALCGMLAYWTGPDPERIDCLFRRSDLMRPKWEEREDYRNSTIDMALAGRTHFYTPNHKGVGTPGAIPYSVQSGKIIHVRTTRDGPVSVPLCNFAAQITEQTTIDDGVEQRITLAVEGTLADGTTLPRAEVPVGEFAGMGWVVERRGTRAVVYADMGTRDHLRAAIQLLSSNVPSRTVFAHTGWRSRHEPANQRSGAGPPGRSAASCASISAGRRLASAGDDKTVKVWEVATGQEAFTLRGHTDPAQRVAFSRTAGSSPRPVALAVVGLDVECSRWPAVSSYRC
jgi:putative DNA primase/helicase